MRTRATPESVKAYLAGLPAKARTQPVPLELVTAAVKFRKLAMLVAARKKAR
jgi:hypothetical protein